MKKDANMASFFIIVNNEGTRRAGVSEGHSAAFALALPEPAGEKSP